MLVYWSIKYNKVQQKHTWWTVYDVYMWMHRVADVMVAASILTVYVSNKFFYNFHILYTGHRLLRSLLIDTHTLFISSLLWYDAHFLRSIFGEFRQMHPDYITTLSEVVSALKRQFVLKCVYKLVCFVRTLYTLYIKHFHSDNLWICHTSLVYASLKLMNYF